MSVSGKKKSYLSGSSGAAASHNGYLASYFKSIFCFKKIKYWKQYVFWLDFFVNLRIGLKDKIFLRAKCWASFHCGLNLPNKDLSASSHSPLIMATLLRIRKNLNRRGQSELITQRNTDLVPGHIYCAPVEIVLHSWIFYVKLLSIKSQRSYYIFLPIDGNSVV